MQKLKSHSIFNGIIMNINKKYTDQQYLTRYWRTA